MKSFEELKVSAEVHRAIKDLGFETPSPIQQQALPILLESPTDFIGLAATGTGKTAAFAIPMIEQIDRTKKEVQVLVMCPTRELALQVTGQINLLGKYKGVKALAVYGGSGYMDQIYGLKSGAMVVVGTPGRLVDHMKRGNLKLGQVQTVIMDEADEMISMGFREDLESILSSTSREVSNIWLFSATMSREVRKVADKYLKEPKLAQVNRTEMLSSTVEQVYYRMRESEKPENLCRLIESIDDIYGLIFCQTKAMVTDLTQYLMERGLKVDCLHGDKDQKAREKSMQAFRDRKVRLLVCTDVASRGLDVKDITHVINYSVPRESELYIHRIGRTARGGKAGIAMSLVTPAHQGLIRRLETLTKTQIKEAKLPSRREIAANAINRVLPKFQSQQFFPKAIELLNDEWKTAIATLSPEEVAGRFLTLMTPEYFDDRPMAKPFNVAQEPEGRQRDPDSRSSQRRFSRERPSRDGGRPYERRSEGRRNFDRADDRPREDRPRFDRTRGDDRRSDDRRSEDRPRFDRPRDDRPREDKRSSEFRYNFKSEGAKPMADKRPEARTERRFEPRSTERAAPRFEGKEFKRKPRSDEPFKKERSFTKERGLKKESSFKKDSKFGVATGGSKETRRERRAKLFKKDVPERAAQAE